MWNAIVSAMTSMFNALHDLIVSLGVPVEKEGVSYVLAIIVFTAIIRLLILPLNIKATKSNAKMQELQLETSKLMKENNVSMFGGCLPSLLPLPILFALYGVFRNITATPGADTSFLFIPDIFGIPKIGFVSIILAILAALSTYIPSLLLSKSMPQQEGGMNMSTMNIMMSGMMGFMALQFQPILIIYWITGGVIQLIQTYFLNYLPSMKKKKIEEEKKAAAQIEKAKKSTPKTKKR